MAGVGATRASRVPGAWCLGASLDIFAELRLSIPGLPGTVLGSSVYSGATPDQAASLRTGMSGIRLRVFEVSVKGRVQKKRKKKWEFSHSGSGPPLPPKSGKKYFFFILNMVSKKP